MTRTGTSSITRQLQLVFAIAIVLLIISAAASFFTNRKLIDASRWVNHTNEVIIKTDSLIAVVRDAEAGQRGYIITGEDDFLRSFNGAREHALLILESLRATTSDNERQQRNLDGLKVLLDERFTQMQRVYEESKTTPLSDRAAFFTEKHAEIMQGKRIMDDLRANIETVVNEERRLLSIRTGRQDLYTVYTPVLTIVAALLAIFICVSAYFRIRADLATRVERQAEDARKYEETRQRINAVEGVTKALATGNYDTRSTDDASDELGRISIALNEMAGALEQNFKELEQRNWLQEGAVTLANAVRGERYVKTAAGKIIASIAAYLQAPVGTLYTAGEAGTLKLQGTYAASNAPEYLEIGSGLMGQAILSGEPLVTEALPAGYLKIASSTGSASSPFVVILPLAQGEHIIGALELGMLKSPSEAQMLFLRGNAESIAISINAALNYERMQELLEETQSQTEELQAQHNELENINAELEMQTEKLQASEEELRVQQEELQQANIELEERSRMLEARNLEITERNTEVQRQAEELVQSTKYKSEFMANMSHELRTPLNSILLLSRLLADNTDASLSEDQVEYARVIQSSGKGLLALIDEILDLSKIEAGKMELEWEEVPLAEIAEDMRVLFEPLAKEKGIALNLEVAEDIPQLVETDKMRLEQVLKNLLSNAMKFTREGSISLIIRKDDTNDAHLGFSVADTGIGIPEDKQRLIFEAFQQADGSTRRKYGGTGLGLSISKELARLLGGALRVHSKPDEGSTFTVTVPMMRDGAAPGKEDESGGEEDFDSTPAQDGEVASQYTATAIPEGIPDDRAAIIAGDKSILIVEDDVAFAKALLDFTRKRGYKGIVAVRGDEGLSLARQYKPAGVLLDIELPVKDGWQVMEALKSDPATRAIPVHIMSSHSVKKESLLKGAVDFINKPVAFEQMTEVFQKLEHVLDRKAKKVLIVEENPKHAKALAYFLESFSINSDIKNSVPESITALKEDTDCVILDMGIPDGQAYEMLDSIKQNPGLETLPIIVFTGKSLSMSEERRIRKYADSIVVKTAHSYQRILDEVSLFLHIVEEQAPKAADKSSARKLGAMGEILKDKTVLVVDDDVRNIFSLTKALEGMHMRILTAVDGKEAIERLAENPGVDIVLLDMMMPKMDGYETARRIRQNGAWKRLPVIAVTAKAMTGDREKCIEAGASDYITKPIDIDQLLSLLRVWLYERGLSPNS